jgi:hypothetical protein
MTMSLVAFQSGLGWALQGGGGCPVDPDSVGIRFTAKVRRSWCEGRAINAARSVLTLLPHDERQCLVAAYVDGGGGQASFLSTEADAFLAFLATRLADPSHALSVCGMEQALACAREGAKTFVPAAHGAATAGGGRHLRQGRHAGMVRFHADPGAVLAALRGGPLPTVGPAGHAVLFAPGLPDLFRAADSDEAALWDAMPAKGSARIADRLVSEGVLEYRD